MRLITWVIFSAQNLIYLGNFQCVATCCYFIGIEAAKCILESQRKSLKLADNWYLLTLHNQSKIVFRFAQLFQHALVTELTNENSNLEEQRKSLTYKKTYVLFGESCLEVFRKLMLCIYSLIKSKLLNTGSITLSKVIKTN